MTVMSSEVVEFLSVVKKVVSLALDGELEHLDDDRRRTLTAALAEADILDLAVETAELEDSLVWLVATVKTVAAISPSVGYALAARYVGQRTLALAADEAERDVTAAVSESAPNDGATFGAILPDLLPARLAVLASIGTGASASVVSVSDNSASDEGQPADVTGLADAQLRVRPVREEAGGQLSPTAADQAATDLAVLFAAVAHGIALAARDSAESYASEREQFGAPIATFAGVRAILIEMTQRCAGVEALLSRAVGSEQLGDALELANAAGSAAVEVSLAAIQVLGGYGYIDEYPVAPLTRDAVTVQARSFSRRAIVAELAGRRLGSIAAEAQSIDVVSGR